MVNNFFKYILVVVAMATGVGPIVAMQTSTALVPMEDISGAIVPVASMDAAVALKEEQLKILRQLMEIQNLRAQIGMQKKLGKELSLDKAEGKALAEQLGGAVSGGLSDALELTKATTAGGVRFVVKIGMAAAFLGFGGVLIYRGMTSGGLDPLKLSGQGLWFLVKYGASWAEELVKKFPDLFKASKPS